MSKIPVQAYMRKQCKESYSKKIISAGIKEILKVAEQNLNMPIKDLVVLDVGAGRGDYTFGIEEYVKKVVGVEPDKFHFQQAIKTKGQKHPKVKFYNTAIEDFKTKEKFDLVLSLTTVEHMPEVEKSFDRTFKMMKKGSVIYLTCPNKWWPIEGHHHLLFLAWLPLSLANKYVKFMKKAESYEDCAYSQSYFGMKNLFKKFSCKYEFVLPKDSNSSYIGCGEGGATYKIIKDIGIGLIRRFPIFWIISKGFIMVITKK